MKASRSGFNAYVFWLLLFIPFSCHATSLNSGIWSGTGESAHGENGTLILGINKNTNMLTGYYESSDRTGNVTAECRFFFNGKFVPEKATLMPIQGQGVHPDLIQDEKHAFSGKIEHRLIAGKSIVNIYLSQIPRSCDWLYRGLPSYTPPKDFTLKTGLSNEFLRNGIWQAVSVIRSKQSYFHTQPHEESRGKAYLVAGDLIYIYDETPHWYYAEYQGERKTTRGWIKKVDAIQIAPPR